MLWPPRLRVSTSPGRRCRRGGSCRGAGRRSPGPRADGQYPHRRSSGWWRGTGKWLAHPSHITVDVFVRHHVEIVTQSPGVGANKRPAELRQITNEQVGHREDVDARTVSELLAEQTGG